jgi:hypothetical protein
MTNTHGPYSALSGLGMTSLVLGMIGMILFFLPILGIPISLFGMLFAIAGLIAALAGFGASLRWSLGGIALCSLSLLTNFALYYAPSSEVWPINPPSMWRPATDRPWVSPPSR